MSAEAVTRGQRGRRRPQLPYEEARRAAAWLAETRAGRSTAELGKLLSVSAGWVHQRESGGTRMTAAEVEEIAAILGVPVPDLTGGA